MSDDLHLEHPTTTDETPAPADAGGTTTDPRAAGDTGEPGPIPYHRFREVNERASAYAKLGKPEELEQKLQKLAEIEQREQQQAAERQAAEEAARRDRNPKLAEAEDLITDVVTKKFPGVADLAARHAETERLQIERHVQHGFEQIPRLLQEYGLPTDKDTVQAYETLVESQILKDDGLKRGFWRPAEQGDVMREAFTRAKQRIVNPALQAAGKTTLDEARERAQRTLGRAGASGTARVEPKKFESKHAPGSAQWESDRAAFNRSAIEALLDTEEQAAI